MRFENINHDCGWQRLLYVTESGKPAEFFPSVHCHSPGGMKTEEKLRLLEDEVGVYVFKFYFGRAGKYVFIFFESDQPQLIAIITVKNNARN